MALLKSFRETTRHLRTRPELFVLGAGIAVIQISLYTVFILGFELMVSSATTPIELIAFTGSFILILPLCVGIYELVLSPAPDDSASKTLRRGVTIGVQRYRAIFRTDVLIAAASGFIGLIVGLGWYVIATIGRYIQYIVADPAAPSAFGSLYLIGMAVVIGGFLGSFLFRFGDVLTAFYGYSPTAAVADSAAACRQNIAPLVGFAAVLVGLQLAPIALLAGLSKVSLPASESSSLALRALVLVALALHAIVITVGSVLHATFFTQHISQYVETSYPVSLSFGQFWSNPSLARWAVAIVLLLGLVGGAAAVRTIDPGVHSAPEVTPVTTDNPDEAVRIAAVTTASSSHRQTLYTRNRSNEKSAYRLKVRSGIDYADRQTYVYYTREDGTEFGGFFGEGTRALLRPGGQLVGLTAYQRGPWTVQATPAWGIAGGSASAENMVVPNGPREGWQLIHANESRMVVRITDSDSIQNALRGRSLDGLGTPLANQSHVTVIIDRKRSVLDEVHVQLHSEATARNHEYRLEYHEVGSADLKRPEAIQDRPLAETVWDAIYY